mmetsp:Transcript_120460/g.341314  ORF Transcript_120460/g.341314 Transcript_120460/m.341314 type:complete len:794 (+) Transcript_120460:47-2428(+)
MQQGMQWTLRLDVCVLGAGFLIWLVLKYRSPVFDKARNLHGTAQSYFLLLRVCRDMFITLTVFSTAVIVPNWGWAPLTVGMVNGDISLIKTVRPETVVLLSFMTGLSSLVLLVFLMRYHTHLKRIHTVSSHLQDDYIERTLWLTDLPSSDSQTGKSFELEDKEFKKVEEDIALALEAKQYGSTRPYNLHSYVERIHVAPVIDEWYHVSCRLRDMDERWKAYNKLSIIPRFGCWGKLVKCWYDRKERTFKASKDFYSKKIKRIEAGRKRMSGSAFVTFQERDSQVYFLRPRPSILKCQCRHHNYFNFGRAPFGSVTLRCIQAPPPEDIIWQNLQFSRHCRRLKICIFTILLFVTMLLLVTPLVIGSQFGELQLPDKISIRQADIKDTLDSICVNGYITCRENDFLHYTSDHAPTLILVAINSLLLPVLIEWIATAAGMHRRSSMEMVQMHLNLFFLLLNSLLFPLLGLQTLYEVGPLLTQGVKEGADISILRQMKFLQEPDKFAIFILRYILNATFVSNTISLVPIHIIICRGIAHWGAVTDRDVRDADTPWSFAWGYWYAWAISMLAIGVLLGVIVPSTLPCSALFFALKHSIDQHNLRHGIYAQGPENEGVFAIRALYYMRLIIAVLWLLMASLFIFWMRVQFSDPISWNSWVPARCVEAWAGVLVLAAIACLLFAQYSLHSSIFETRFERTLDVIRAHASCPILTCPRLASAFDNCLSALFGHGGLSSDGSRPLDASLDESCLEDTVSEDGCLLWDAKYVVMKDDVMDDGRKEVPYEITTKPAVDKDEQYL